MEVTLKSVEDNISVRERDIFNVLKATLQYPSNSEARGVQLADNINFFCAALEKDGIKAGDTTFYTWCVVLDIVCCIPPGHAWQDSLLHAIKNLRQRVPSAVPENNERINVRNPISIPRYVLI